MTTTLRFAVVVAALAFGNGVRAQSMGAPQEMPKPTMAHSEGAKGMKDMKETTGMKMTHGFAPFTKEAFKQANDEGKMTLIFFHAPWCPICRALEPKVLAHLASDAKNVVAFKADYDSSAELRKEMNVQQQSTLILYSGAKEVARLASQADDAALVAFFKHATMMMKKETM